MCIINISLDEVKNKPKEKSQVDTPLQISLLVYLTISARTGTLSPLSVTARQTEIRTDVKKLLDT